MIDIKKFKDIRSTNHLIVLDTNILLELYRQPANISLDIINVIEKVKDKIYIPRQVYDEYIRNYQEICGKERKKYQKVKKKLSESARKLQDDIDTKINEYRKHNYTDISRLENELYQKIGEIQDIINKFEHEHKNEIQFNIDFLKKDKVKELVDFLELEGRIGAEISFSQRLLILQEGQIRFESLIPPGFLDKEKAGMDKYGDLFVWKSIITVAKEQNANIIFVCNDVKEDWWKKDKGLPIDLRDELYMEFNEINPLLNIHFLTLDKFFNYMAEELQIGKSKSALQLSANEDAKEFISDYQESIEQEIIKVFYSIDIVEELGQEYIRLDDEKIYWEISYVSVDKEEKNINYYITLNISILADLTDYECDENPFNIGKVALVLEGKLTLTMEEYATENNLESIEVKLNEIYHIEFDEWKKIRQICEGMSCKDIIKASKALKKYSDNIKEKVGNCEEVQSISGAIYGLQELINPLQGISNGVSALERMDALQIFSEPISTMAKIVEPISVMAKTTEPINTMAKIIEPISNTTSVVEPFCTINTKEKE